MKRTRRRGEVQFPIRPSQMSTRKIYGCHHRMAAKVAVVKLLADRHRVVNRGRKANLVKIAAAVAAAAVVVVVMMDGVEMVGGDRHGHQQLTMTSQQR